MGGQGSYLCSLALLTYFRGWRGYDFNCVKYFSSFLALTRLIVSIFLNVGAGSSDDTAQVENVMSCLRSKSSYDISLAAGVRSKFVSYLATVTFNGFLPQINLIKK